MNTDSSTMIGSKAGDCGCGGGHGVSSATYGTGSHGLGGSGKTGACGCGGSCGGGCGGGCGGTGGGVAGSSAFVRPRFFGGMLLSEDDLQAIDDYTVAKRRLTNRHMFGPGVVCGLDVDCDPCKPGWVTVTPGYALDCCGNDIVVGCPEKLDALALLNELRRRSGGDCGEPCDDKPQRRYLLVVSYAEQPTDPVAPYVQDDCAVGDCDFSRVREGYRFELVCDVEDPDPSLLDRLRECVRPDDEETKADVNALVKVARLAETQARVAAVRETGEVPKVDIPNVQEFGEVRKEAIGPKVALLSRSTAALAAAAAHDVKRGPAIGLGAQRRESISDNTRKLARELLASDELKELPELERARVNRVLVAARDQQDLEELDVEQRVWLAEGYGAPDAQAAFAREAQSVRSRIVKRLERTGRGNCREREEVERLPLDRLDRNSRDHVWRLGQSFWSILVGCLCDNVNPPCPQCTETRVPLASVLIEGCEVVDVCALNRQWVLAPRTLNYWVPIVDELRRLLLSRCCAPERGYRPSAVREVETLREQGVQAMSMVRSPLDAPEFRALREVLVEPVVVAPAPAAAPPGTPPAASAAPPVPTAGVAPEAERVETLEKQLEELREQVRKLSGGTP